MKIARLVPVGALLALPFVTGTASAARCVTVPALDGGVVACVNHNGCTVYENAGGPYWTQFSPICI